MSPSQGQGLNRPERGRVDVSRGPAHGLAIAVPWAIVIWLAIAVMVLGL